MPPTTYAVVQDVPASWNVYLLRARQHEQMPEGLLFHAAGPTDEGFRVIDVWESQADWEHFRDRQQPGPIDGSLESQLSRSTVRDLEVHDLYLTSSNLPLGRTT